MTSTCLLYSKERNAKGIYFTTLIISFLNENHGYSQGWPSRDQSQSRYSESLFCYWAKTSDSATQRLSDLGLTRPVTRAQGRVLQRHGQQDPLWSHCSCTSSLPPGLSESRRIARQRLAIRDSVKMSASAIRRFGDSVIPRIRGCQLDLAGPGQAQRWSYAAQATQATHLHYTKQTS